MIDELNYSFGDILWCSREFDGLVLEEGHKEGPFLLLQESDNFIYALKGSSVHNRINKGFGHYDFILDKTNSLLRNPTYFQMNDIYKVPKENIITYVGTIEENQQNYIKKSIMTARNRNVMSSDYEDFIISNIKYKIGDILIKDGIKYLIFNIGSDESFDLVPVEIRDNKYIYKYDEIFKTKIIDDYKLDITNLKDNYQYFQLKYFIHRLRKNNSKIENVGIGSIISYRGKVYYISSVDKQNYLCYQLDIAKEYGLNYICLDGVMFQIDFNQSIINIKNDKIISLMKTTQDQIEFIRKLKKDNKRAVKNNPKSKNDKEFNYYYCSIYRYKNNRNGRYALYYAINNYTGYYLDLDLFQKGIFEVKMLEHDQLYTVCGRKEFMD